MAELTITADALSKTAIIIPKLKEDGSNWANYHDRMLDYLNGQPGFRKHLTGRARPPKALSIADQMDDDKVEAYEDALDLYIQRQSAIRSIILGSLPEKIQIRIKS